MTTAWPANVPSCLALDGFSYAPVSNGTPIDVESGEPVTRARFTGDQMDISGILRCTLTQAQALYTLYKTTLVDGTLRVSVKDPLLGTTVDALFTAAPVFTRSGAQMWKAAVQLRLLP